MTTLFLPGMYVRVGVDDGSTDEGFRDFRIGQVSSVEPDTRTAQVTLLNPDPATRQLVGVLQEHDLDRLERCRILPNSDATFIPSGDAIRILLACSEDLVGSEPRTYYAQVGARLQVVSERDVAVASNRQDPDPFQQLRSYELHQPVWRTNRNAVVEQSAELQNATFGVEDLVGSRILLLAHQAEVVANVLRSVECRYILADEVGLGKTVEACVTLKGLRRRHPHMQTLIVVPASLLQQWHNELDEKFWLDFPVLGRGWQSHGFEPDHRLGAIVSVEDLAEDTAVWERLKGQPWGLFIADEVHHLYKNPVLYERVQVLSRLAERVLLLSATPIQRRAKEYLALLALLDPIRYDHEEVDSFERVLSLQSAIIDFTSYQARGIADDMFDADEFIGEVAPILKALAHDTALAKLASRIATYREQPRRCVEAATLLLAYLSENYRVESRVIRNRRTHLKVELPVRKLDDSYAYEPAQLEANALDSLLEYLSIYTREHSDSSLTPEYCRALMHAAASSPHALESALQERAAGGRGGKAASWVRDLRVPAPPREERARIRALIQATPISISEQSALEGLLRCAERWREETDGALEAETMVAARGNTGRLQAALLAIDRAMREPKPLKVLVFTSWPETLEALRCALGRRYRRDPDRVAQFHNGLPAEQLQREADRFQEHTACRIMLCDELGGEGRNFQVADRIIHVDIPWTPAQIEQRIGRVDRLGRAGAVLSIVPFALGWPEHDLFRIWQEAFSLFTRSMSGMEIVLEGIQNDLAAAICADPRDGLRESVDSFVVQAGQLRKDVEIEQHFERPAINDQLRKAFRDTSERYRDGEVLREALLGWATVAGLGFDYYQYPTIVRFDPRAFNPASMRNAKIAQLPDMREALRRSLRPHELVIRGTFNRDIAVQREDLVFFAPGTDPWTDGLIASAFEADRGRSCAILRGAPALRKDWRGFEFLFSIAIDPRPLYALGYGPAHLFRAQGFLRVSTYRVLASVDGAILDRGSEIAHILKKPYDNKLDKHLGKRSGAQPPIAILRSHFPRDQWTAILGEVERGVLRHLLDTFSYMEDEAADARREFALRAKGWRAARQWLISMEDDAPTSAEIDEYEQISGALVEGIRRPMMRLESGCFWWLRGRPD